jgi:hypothetical protein
MIENSIRTRMAIGSLEMLNKQYNNVLNQYKSVQQDYIAFLQKEQNKKEKNRSFVSIQGQSFFGTGESSSKENNNVTNIEDCIALCSATDTCTGATFKKTETKNVCLLRTGTGNTVPTGPDDYAIIPENLRYLNILQRLNTQLTNINEQLLNRINTSEPFYNEQDGKREEKKIYLKKQFQNLLKENENIKKKKDEYKDLEGEYSETNLKITKRIS